MTVWQGIYLDSSHYMVSPVLDPTVESRLGDGAATLPVPTVAPPVVVRPSFEPTPLQPPFQSSSSPVHLSHRFMVSGCNCCLQIALDAL